MALRITKAEDPIQVSNIVLTVYSAPGVGKTTLGFTADKPLLLDFDGGAYRSQFRGDTVQINAWADVRNMSKADLDGYNTIVVDTVGRALDTITQELIASNPKFKGFGGALSLQGYGALKAGFIGWLTTIKSYGKDVILLAHMDEQRNGDDTIERLDVQGGSKNEIYKSSDVMGRLSITGGQRILSFDPTATSFGKNPAGLPALNVPDCNAERDFLSATIATIKEALNAQSEEVKAERQRLEELRTVFGEYTTVEEFNKQVKSMAKAKPADKKILVSVASGKGFKFNADKKVFEAAA